MITKLIKERDNMAWSDYDIEENLTSRAEKLVDEIEKENQSQLPNLMSIKQDLAMKVIVVAPDKTMEKWETTLTIPDEPDKFVSGILLTVSDPRVVGYLPSKVIDVVQRAKTSIFEYFSDDPEIRLVYYINDSLPKAVQPFEGNLNVLVTYQQNIEYSIDWRIFINQEFINGRLAHIIIFGDNLRKQILKQRLDGNA